MSQENAFIGIMYDYIMTSSWLHTELNTRDNQIKWLKHLRVKRGVNIGEVVRGEREELLEAS